MTWTLTDDIDAYLAAAGDLLRSQPERYTILLTLTSTLRRLGPHVYGDAPVFGWWSRDGQVRSAVLQTPPHPMLVTALPGEAASDLGEALVARGSALSGVNGAAPDAEAFAAAWLAVAGRAVRTRQRQRLYRVERLVPPDPAPQGTARAATESDAELVRAWYAAFAADTGQDVAPGNVIDVALRAGRLLLWEVDDEPVALAARLAMVEGVVRIGQVYAPPGQRGRGYGGAVTAAMNRIALDHGARSVILFTDLANPVSNRLYVRLGYRPVEDKVILEFEH